MNGKPNLRVIAGGADAPTMCLFFSHDGDEHGVKFGFALCNEASLLETVSKALYTDGVIPDDQAEQVAQIIAQLLDAGAYDFEDGWIALRRGLPHIVDFLIEQLRNTKAEEIWADGQRAEQHKRAGEWQAKYLNLCEALADALGAKAMAVADVAAGGLRK